MDKSIKELRSIGKRDVLASWFGVSTMTIVTLGVPIFSSLLIYSELKNTSSALFVGLLLFGYFSLLTGAGTYGAVLETKKYIKKEKLSKMAKQFASPDPFE